MSVCQVREDTNYLDIAAGILEGDTLVAYLFIICLDYRLRKSIHKVKEKSFMVTNKEGAVALQKQITTRTTPMI